MNQFIVNCSQEKLLEVIFCGQMYIAHLQGFPSHTSKYVIHYYIMPYNVLLFVVTVYLVVATAKCKAAVTP